MRSDYNEGFSRGVFITLRRTMQMADLMGMKTTFISIYCQNHPDKPPKEEAEYWFSYWMGEDVKPPQAT